MWVRLFFLIFSVLDSLLNFEMTENLFFYISISLCGFARWQISTIFSPLKTLEMDRRVHASDCVDSNEFINNIEFLDDGNFVFQS